MKRDDVTGLAPTGDLGLIEKSSFLFDSLLFGPDWKKKHNQALCEDPVTRDVLP